MRSIAWFLGIGALAIPALVGGCMQTSNSNSSGRIAIAVTEKGFEPEVVTVAAGKPVTLVVTRRTTNTCATELVLAGKGIKKELPLGQPVEITFTPHQPGELRYACGMDMLSGKVIVK